MALMAIAVLLISTAQAQPLFRRLFNMLRPAAAPPQAVDATEPEETDGTRSLVLPDNGDLRRKLELVRGQIEGQHYSDAARALGHFLQDTAIRDFFLSQGEDRRGGRSFFAEVRRLLSELPPEGQAAYRVQFEPVARAQLNAAINRGDEAVLRDVALRFPETSAGDEALYRLAHFLWDHGRPRAAVACLGRLTARPAASAPFEPAISVLAAACWGRLGNQDQARTALIRAGQSVPGTAPQIARAAWLDAATDEGFAAFIARLGGDRSQAAVPFDDWPVFRGDPARNCSVPARAPFLGPRWSIPVSSAQTQLAIDRAWQSYREGAGTSLPLLNPLAVGDLFLARTARGVAAYNIETGECRWRHPADDDGENSGLDRILWRESSGGSFSADDECVYLVDGGRMGDADSGIPCQNSLSAREHFGSREGNLRWQVGGPDGGAEPQLAGTYFLGPPQCWQGRLYLIAERQRGLSLIVLDRASGRLAWSQELALVEQDLAADLPRLLGGATPSISQEEIIVCPTSGGAVVAIDLTTQSLLWAYRYARKISMPGGIVAFDVELEPTPRLDQFGRWLDATAAIRDDTVVVTPTESHEIHGLDLKSGELKWTRPRGEGMFVACLTDAHVVVVGRRHVQALQLVDGEPAWIRALPDGAFPAGRGVFTGERYYLPLTSPVVLEIELAAGSVAAVHKSPRELPVGNLIWHKGLFLSQGPTALEAFDEREWLVNDIRESLDRNPRDPEALLRHGDFEQAAGRIAEAVAAFRTAHSASPSGRAKSKLVSALLEAVRRDVPDKEALSRELDGLIGP